MCKQLQTFCASIAIITFGIEKKYYNWLTEDMGALYKEFSSDELQLQLKRLSIDKIVLIQAVPDTAATEYMLAIASRFDFIAGVVAWIDMQDPQAPYFLARLSRNPHFKGIRPMIQEIQQDEWMLNPSFAPAFLSLSQLGLCFDALVKPRHLKGL